MLVYLECQNDFTFNKKSGTYFCGSSAWLLIGFNFCPTSSRRISGNLWLLDATICRRSVRSSTSRLASGILVDLNIDSYLCIYFSNDWYMFQPFLIHDYNKLNGWYFVLRASIDTSGRVTLPISKKKKTWRCPTFNSCGCCGCLHYLVKRRVGKEYASIHATYPADRWTWQRAGEKRDVIPNSKPNSSAYMRS
jgi:hypothetical protein